LTPAKIDAENCFSSPTRTNGQDDWTETIAEQAKTLLPSLSRFPHGTPLKTPSRLQPLQEHIGVTLDVDNEELAPVWVARSPSPAQHMSERDAQDLGAKLHSSGLLSSPAPPGLRHFNSLPVPSVSVKNTFIQFESPMCSRGLLTPPKSVPANLAPTVHPLADSPFEQPPRSWSRSNMLPAAERYDVPGPTSECASCEEVSVGESAHQRVPQIEGRVVRLADFLTEDPPEPSELLHWPGSFRH